MDLETHPWSLSESVMGFFFCVVSHPDANISAVKGFLGGQAGFLFQLKLMMPRSGKTQEERRAFSREWGIPRTAGHCCSGAGTADGGAPGDEKPPGSVHAAVRGAHGANRHGALSSWQHKGSPIP